MRERERRTWRRSHVTIRLLKYCQRSFFRGKKRRFPTGKRRFGAAGCVVFGQAAGVWVPVRWNYFKKNANIYIIV